MPKVLCIVGTTASGKSTIAVELARIYGGEVVSVDSMQIYRGMDIGTAKPSKDEMRGVPHHMIDVADPREPFSVSRFVDMADAVIDDILARGHLPVLAGGTGLYMKALTDGMRFSGEGRDDVTRAKLMDFCEKNGRQALHNMLREIDPQTADKLHLNDVRRVIRAIELYRQTGITMSQHVEETKKLLPRRDAVYIGMRVSDRQSLYARIDRRVDEMLKRGLEDEVRRLLADGVPQDCTAMQAIGYKELALAIRGERTVTEAAEDVKRESRRYAKRQMTWFGADKRINWVEAGDREPEDTIFDCKTFLNRNIYL